MVKMSAFPVVIAHRGSNRQAPENSRQAFRLAVLQGARRIETDLQWTKDHIPVICHDDNMFRTFSVNLQISRQNFSSLRSGARRANGETILTLQEVLEEFLPVVELNLEIKGKRTETEIQSLITLVRQSSAPENVILSCFDWQPLFLLKEMAPELDRAVLWGRDTLKRYPWYFLNPVSMMQKCHSRIFHPEASCLNPYLMKIARRYGWQVFPWVPLKGEDALTREKLWSKMISMGIDGLCTNEPKLFSEWIKNYQR
ncbi:MAG: glycerophosphodiester phosphodiesterase [Deltaproteobacteria bacterium]|nr:glycerophosphodiester phosphodiesterase [Deltaproteobacteria bacterium]